MPYIIQLLGAMLELNPSTSLPPFYKSLINTILGVDYWTSKGNIPALVRLLAAMISKGAADFVEGKQLVPVLGIFERLMSIRSSQAFAFELLECIVTSFSQLASLPIHKSMANIRNRQDLKEYWKTIFQTLLVKLQNQKTDAFTARFVRFYHYISAYTETGFGADFFIAILDSIQAEFATCTPFLGLH
jgi:exportin-2 (importin alpha re-exporter)